MFSCSLTETVLSPEAVAFALELHQRFGERRRALVERRATEAPLLDFPTETQSLREDAAWSVAPTPGDCVDRRVEFYGPVDAQAIDAALASTASGFVATFDVSGLDVIAGHAALLAAIRADRVPPRLIVELRGFDIETEVLGQSLAAGLLDFALFVFHCAPLLTVAGRGVYLQLTRLEHRLEARWWNDVMDAAEDLLGLAPGAVRATVAIDTAAAALQMDELLWELRAHSLGLAAAASLYVASLLRSEAALALPDDDDLSLKTPFMHGYLTRLVTVCHRRGTYALGPAAPSSLPLLEPAGVRDDAGWQAGLGFDGTRVTEPAAIRPAFDEFVAMTGSQTNQLRRRPPAEDLAGREDLLTLSTPFARLTREGVRVRIRCCLTFVGSGDVATRDGVAAFDVCRLQLMRWVREQVALADGGVLSPELLHVLLGDEGCRGGFAERSIARVGDLLAGG